MQAMMFVVCVPNQLIWQTDLRHAQICEGAIKDTTWS